MARRWWGNQPQSRSTLAELDVLQRRYGARLRTVSFHDYL